MNLKVCNKNDKIYDNQTKLFDHNWPYPYIILLPLMNSSKNSVQSTRCIVTSYVIEFKYLT